jgi:hypothetical protein
VEAARLILTAGAWAPQLLSSLQLPLTVRRKVGTWCEHWQPEFFTEGRTRVFTFPENWLYGFPNIANRGVKLVEHLGRFDLPMPTLHLRLQTNPTLLPSEQPHRNTCRTKTSSSMFIPYTGK